MDPNIVEGNLFRLFRSFLVGNLGYYMNEVRKFLMMELISLNVIDEFSSELVVYRSDLGIYGCRRLWSMINSCIKFSLYFSVRVLAMSEA